MIQNIIKHKAHSHLSLTDSDEELDGVERPTTPESYNKSKTRNLICNRRKRDDVVYFILDYCNNNPNCSITSNLLAEYYRKKHQVSPIRKGLKIAFGRYVSTFSDKRPGMKNFVNEIFIKNIQDWFNGKKFHPAKDTKYGIRKNSDIQNDYYYWLERLKQLRLERTYRINGLKNDMHFLGMIKLTDPNFIKLYKEVERETC